jgi:YVTN family beta-propeller protein
MRRSRRAGVSRRARAIIALVAVACLAAAGLASASVVGVGPFGNEQVGQQYANGILLPTNQWISPPIGSRILDRSQRLVSSSLSPDGTYLAALGWNNYDGTLTIYDLKTGATVQKTSLGPGSVADDTSVAADGPLWSPDGTTLWVPQSGDLDKFTVDPATGQATQADSIALCSETPPTSSDCSYGPAEPDGDFAAYLPSGMALSPDGSKLYVAFNGKNTLGVIDTASDQLVQQIPVGNAPRQVVLADGGRFAYVSNEGGRPSNGEQFTNLSDGTPIVSSNKTGAATSGTVSVVNLTKGKETREIKVGLQPTALYQTGKTLFVANSNDDSMSEIDESTEAVVHTIKTNPVPDVRQVGSNANAISQDGDQLLVSIGRDNAIAVYSYAGGTSEPAYQGLVPTDWYPVNAQPDPALGAGAVVVTNDKGIGALGPDSTISKGPYTQPATGHNTYDDTGSITEFTMPDSSTLSSDTSTVFTDNDWNDIPSIDSGADDTVPSVIPAKLGDPSPIKHVVVIVKENRTYDQVLGDLGEGNGDPADAQFGAQVTPNFHSLADRFGDLDDFYDEGTLSADGHNWLVQANANDYVEKQFGAFYRSYPSQGGDSLAYQPDGFLWNAAEKAGRSVADFGEYAYYPYNLPAGTPGWDAWYKDSQILEGKASGPLPVPTHEYQTHSDIPSLNKILDPWFPNFQLQIPDQYRVDMWNQEFDSWVKHGSMPDLQFMWLMSDHTAGAGTGDPDPVAEVADNDLAVGRVVDEISHSRFWKSTAIFVVEDDTQNGVDHVDGHRGPAFVISPYSAGGVEDGYDTQVNMVRTIEQILGIPSMNQNDGSAEPMYSAFTAKPDFAPYDVQPNQIPLTLGAPGYPSTMTSPAPDATAAAKRVFRPQGEIPADMRGVYAAWQRWAATQRFNGPKARPDSSNPAMLNRYDWYSAHNWKVAYPGDGKIELPSTVPGRNIPRSFLGGD